MAAANGESPEKICPEAMATRTASGVSHSPMLARIAHCNWPGKP
jgi:hypothetical protein